LRYRAWVQGAARTIGRRIHACQARPVNAPFEKYFASRVRKHGAPALALFRRKFQFEPLEQRLLLSADVASPAAADLLVTAPSRDPVAPLTDEAQASPVVISEALKSYFRAAAWASSGPETGFVELDNAPRIVTSPGGAVRALIASGTVDNEWHITGPDQGTLNGVPFSGINVLLGGRRNIKK